MKHLLDKALGKIGLMRRRFHEEHVAWAEKQHDLMEGMVYQRDRTIEDLEASRERLHRLRDSLKAKIATHNLAVQQPRVVEMGSNPGDTKKALAELTLIKLDYMQAETIGWERAVDDLERVVAILKGQKRGAQATPEEVAEGERVAQAIQAKHERVLRAARGQSDEKLVDVVRRSHVVVEKPKRVNSRQFGETLVETVSNPMRQKEGLN